MPKCWLIVEFGTKLGGSGYRVDGLPPFWDTSFSLHRKNKNCLSHCILTDLVEHFGHNPIILNKSDISFFSSQLYNFCFKVLLFMIEHNLPYHST